MFPEADVSGALSTQNVMFPELYVPGAQCSRSSVFPGLYVPGARCFRSPKFQELFVSRALCSRSTMFSEALCSRSSMFPEPDVPGARCSRGCLSPEQGLRFRVRAHSRGLNHAGVMRRGLLVHSFCQPNRHRHTWFSLQLPLSQNNPRLKEQRAEGT